MRSEKGARNLFVIAITVTALIFALMLASCGRGITPFQAANGGAKCGRLIK
jgi:hypothetical protein